MSRRTFLSVLVVCAVFVAGALAGAAVVRFGGWWGETRSADVEGRRSGEPGDPEWRDFDGEEGDRVYEITRYLDEELGLRPEQESEVRAILERRTEVAEELFRESRRRFIEHFDSTAAEIARVLDAEQAEAYERILEEYEERRARERTWDP